MAEGSTQEPTTAPAPASDPVTRVAPFEVHLAVFEGPFDLLLRLIAKHQLDVTEVALSQVTDEFIAFIRAAGSEWDLGQATEFLVVAATLLDLKAARLLPAGEVDDEEDVALLEARDLLFARLLQYKAYKEAAAILARLMSAEDRRWPRSVTLEEPFAAVQPDVLAGVSAATLAAAAVRALTPRPVPVVDTGHVHLTRVSVRERAATVAARLAVLGAAAFRSLVADCRETVEVVATFLAVLELYREGLVAFEQITPLGDLTVRWTGGSGPVELTTEEYDGALPAEAAADAPGSPDQVGADDVSPELAAGPSDAGARPGAGLPAAGPPETGVGDPPDQPPLTPESDGGAPL